MDVLEVLQTQLRFRHHCRDQLIILEDVDRRAFATIGAVQRADEGAARSYRALHELNTRPAIAYLAKVRRDTEEGGG